MLKDWQCRKGKTQDPNFQNELKHCFYMGIRWYMMHRGELWMRCMFVMVVSDVALCCK